MAEPLRALTFDPAGERLTGFNAQNEEQVWDYRRGSVSPPAELKTPDGEGWMHNEWLHMKGKNGGLVIRVLPADKPDGRPKPGEWHVPDEFDSSLAYLAPGEKRLVVRHFAVAGEVVKFSVVDLTDPKSKTALLESPLSPRFGVADMGPEISSDGKWVVFVRLGRRPDLDAPPDGVVAVFDLNARRLHTRVEVPARFFSHGAFSPDSRTFAVVAFDHIALVDTGTWKVRRTIHPPRDMAQGRCHIDASWSPDGKLLATTTSDGRIAVWDTVRVLAGTR